MSKCPLDLQPKFTPKFMGSKLDPLANIHKTLNS